MYKFFVFTLLVFFCYLPLQAGFVIKEGKLRKAEKIAHMSAMEHYSVGLKSMEDKNWDNAAHHFYLIVINYSTSPLYEDAIFYLGVSLFHCKDYFESNNYLTEYLKQKNRLKHFEEAFSYKLAIASKLEHGAQKHLFNWKKMPKLIPAKEEALELYDEIITTLPNHQLAADAMNHKAKLLFKMQDYKTCIETYQTLIKRFPKHEFAPDAYIAISDVYLKQLKSESQNPDLIDLATINLRNFQTNFPKDPKLKLAKQELSRMHEIQADGFYETGRFYERKKKFHASVIYYVHALDRFPETKAAEKSYKRLKHKLHKYAKELNVAEELYN